MTSTTPKAPIAVINDGLVPLESVLCTEELDRRPSRSPDHATESRALVRLVQALADSPRTILQTLAETMLDVFRCGSAGISLLTKDAKRFYWPAISGAWRPHVGSGTPRDFGPCGDVFHRNAPLLFRHWERRYPDLRSATPLAEEGLLVPFHVNGNVVGTVWLLAHDDRRKFDSEDLRLLGSLGRFASAAYQAVQSVDAREQRRAALNLMEDAVQAREAMEQLNVALRASEQRFRALFDLGPVAVYSCDNASVIQEFNRRAADLWGRAPAPGDTDERFCGSFKLYRPDGTFVPHERCPMAEVLSGEISAARDEEVVIERPDGSRVSVIVNIVPLTDERGKVAGAINCFFDITDRKRAEEALREAEKRFRKLADNIPQLAWIAEAGSDGQVHWFNQSWLSYTGTTLDEMKGSGWKAVVHPEYVERVARKFEHHVRAGLDWEDTFPLRGKDGHYRWFLSRMNVIRDESGAVVQIFGTNTDVTEQREMADELLEADRRKNEFLALLAHELRNPLAPIRNAVQILQRGDAIAAASAADMIERQIGQMVRLVDDLLDVSRISRGKIELRRGRLDLTPAVNDAVEAILPQCKRMNHELTVTLPPQPIYLNADATRMTQIVGNLLNNACKFTSRGGHIWLTVERAGEEVAISVRDSGIGIAADQLVRIFDMFTQVDASLERSASGLGIGLALAKNLVEMHGGTLKGHSEGLGRGSEFVVRLPILVEAPKSPPERTAESEPTLTTSRRILVVDDNLDSAESLADLLKFTGNETTTAHDGLEAVETARTFRPDVILLDIGLPKLNGYEACRRIREQPWSDGMVLVALTGWGHEEDLRTSKAAGFDAHLVKPVSFAILTKLLADLLPAPV